MDRVECRLASIVLFFCGLFYASSVSAATLYPSKIKFQHILQNKDVVLGEVREIFQDSEGFIWLGGWNGLVRYDGYEFKAITLQREINGEIVDESVNGVVHIIQDSKQNLWMASVRGIYRYDVKKSKIEKLPDDESSEKKIDGLGFTRVIELPTGEMFAASNDGVLIFDSNTFEYRAWNKNKEGDPDEFSLAHETVQGAYLDSEERLWLGHHEGIDLFDWRKGTFKHYLVDPTHWKPGSNLVQDITGSDDNQLWVATNASVSKFNPETGKAKHYKLGNDGSNGLGTGEVWDLLVDSRGRLWAAHDQGGVSLYVANEDRFINYRNKASITSSLASNQVRTLFEDDNGDLWFGLYPEGVDFFDQSSTAITTFTTDISDSYSLNHNKVTSISEDAKGNLWLGTDGGGINFYDRKANRFTHFKSDSADNETLKSNAILSTLLDSKGKLWVGSWGGGVNRLDPLTGKVKQYDFSFDPQTVSSSKRLNSGHVWAMIEDKEGYIWLATHTGGINKFDPETEVFHHYWHKSDDPSTISADWVWTVHEDPDGKLWVGTTASLDLMDKENGTFTHFQHDPENPESLSKGHVLAIYTDSKGRLWVGTEYGLNLFDPEKDRSQRITKEDGLYSDNVRGIIEDEQGNIWLGTASGVSSYNPETQEINNYYRDSGKLIGFMFYNAVARSKQGEIIMGGASGLRIYRPKELVANSRIPPLALTQFKVFSESIIPGGEDGLLTQDINHTTEIILDYTKSMFVFEFAALNFRDSEKNRYAYKLEGFDKDWIYLDSEHSAKYTNLDPGKYRFRVKGTNNDGVWNEEGKSISIVQLPAPWLTWWAYTIYGLIALISVGMAIQHQRRKRVFVEQQNRLLEEKVAERTAELRRKNHDIQSMLSNMRQGLFTIEENLDIHPEYSQYLERIFETNEIAGKSAIDLLFVRAKVDQNKMSEMVESVKLMMGESALNFDFNSHLLMKEFDVDLSGNQKHLSLDWNPIIVENRIEKLMVTVRDVTIVRKMEEEAIRQQRELDIIGQLIQSTSRKIVNFEQSAYHLLEDSYQLLRSGSEVNDELIEVLFRNIHTIKGNCRMINFSHLGETTHVVETELSQLKEDKGVGFNRDALLTSLDRVKEVVDEYSKIYHEVLGRDNDNHRGDGYWLDNDKMGVIKKCVELAHYRDPEVKEAGDAKHILDEITSNPLKDCLEDLLESLPSIAEELQKPAPTIRFNECQCRILRDGQELISNVFTHLLRNSLDHGIESAEERNNHGKLERGSISISTQMEDDRLQIHVSDDGQGLNLTRLYEKGREIGEWSNTSTPSAQSIADVVFRSGLSTKETVSEISGRGVGLDAVKEFLLKEGGDIQIQLLQKNELKEGFFHFKFIVTLPARLLVMGDFDAKNQNLAS